MEYFRSAACFPAASGPWSEGSQSSHISEIRYTTSLNNLPFHVHKNDHHSCSLVNLKAATRLAIHGELQLFEVLI